MSTRNTRRTTNSKKGTRKPSVVGSTLGDVSTRSRGRGLPRGGIREPDGLKVAEGALPDSTIMGSGDRRDHVRKALRIAVVVLAFVIVLLVLITVVLGVLSNTSAFLVSRIETFDSDHVTADEVARLSNVGEGVTLLNVDDEAIRAGVCKNPWVSSVDVERVFPDTLRLHVNERKLGAVVAMSSGGVAWLLGDDNVWIEPIKLEVSQTESSNDAALAKANSLGVILISDVPSEVSPAAGTPCSDPSIQTVMSIASQLSDSFKEKIVCYSASSQDDISCILQNGVEISFGSDSDISTKEAVATRMLEEYGGQIIYINVRTPSRPTYRRVDSEYVREGTGATGTAVDKESVVPKVRALEDEEGTTDDSSNANDQEQNEDDNPNGVSGSDSNGDTNEYGATNAGQESYGSSDPTANGYDNGTYNGYGTSGYGTSTYGYDDYESVY